MDDPLALPRNEDPQDYYIDSHVLATTEKNLYPIEMKNKWVIITGFSRHLISIMRPHLEIEIGPIDKWINHNCENEVSSYYVCFRNEKLALKALQYNKEKINGINLTVTPCYDHIFKNIEVISENQIPPPEYFRHSKIPLELY
ncbi:uncharacterized protein CMU_000940 [Cryptosporidium muris RN66]|uniref:RRM Nup35-type domain-containing protein n=1 Tax=Cryptosporidium muris (strain RN66) TaxID=441375 RepID=B6AG82_CRYMR|nr:uncharacterized protein CMU_000940 [Cryptosporidium muris RN66]EEA07223.1 hypothetical protein, conserved [Cryptosporidium muris RN66]|eukprot:XP_002141572.1 hypothetical protein [Cryptosporidium muris RN66]